MTVLETAKSHLFDAVKLPQDHLPRHGVQWGTLFKRSLQAIAGFKSVPEAIVHAQTACSFDHRFDLQPLYLVGRRDEKEHQLIPCDYYPEAGALFTLYQDALGSEYPRFKDLLHCFADSPHSKPETMAGFGGRKVSNITFFHAFYILSQLSFCCFPKAVCEIGGGYGDTARLWLGLPFVDIQLYCICDLPTSLFYAETYLRANYPDLQIVYILGEADLKKVDFSKKAVLLFPIAVAHLTKGLKFDIIHNEHSLGEMSAEWNHFWAGWLAQQEFRYFYSHNYFALPIDALYEGATPIGPELGEGFRVVFSRMNHSLWFMQSKDRNAAELVFQKDPEGQAGPDAVALFALVKKRRLSLNDLPWLVYGFLTIPDPVAVFELIVQSERDLGFYPKEMLYLARKLSQKHGGALSEGQRAILDSVLKHLEGLYAEALKIHDSTDPGSGTYGLKPTT